MKKHTKVKCECGNVATWCYIPSDRNSNCCDDCVPRGCSCNNDINDKIKHPCCEWIYSEKGWDE